MTGVGHACTWECLAVRWAGRTRCGHDKGRVGSLSGAIVTLCPPVRLQCVGILSGGHESLSKAFNPPPTLRGSEVLGGVCGCGKRFGVQQVTYATRHHTKPAHIGATVGTRSTQQP